MTGKRKARTMRQHRTGQPGDPNTSILAYSEAFGKWENEMRGAGAVGEYEAICMYGMDDYAQYVPTDCWFMLLDRAGGVL